MMNSDSVTKEPYYHGVLSRDDADDCLIDHGAVDGSYLLRQFREGGTGELNWIVSAVHGGRVQHYDVSVQHRGGRTLYSLGGVKSGSMQQLLELYSDPHMGPPAPLTEMVKYLGADKRERTDTTAGPALEGNNPFLTAETAGKSCASPSPSKASTSNPFLVTKTPPRTTSDTETAVGTAPQLSPFNPFTQAVESLASTGTAALPQPVMQDWGPNLGSGLENDDAGVEEYVVSHGNGLTDRNAGGFHDFGRVPGTSSSVPTTAEPASDSEAFWSCSVCTYDNHPLIAHCEMCDSARADPVSSPHAPLPSPMAAPLGPPTVVGAAQGLPSQHHPANPSGTSEADGVSATHVRSLPQAHAPRQIHPSPVQPPPSHNNAEARVPVGVVDAAVSSYPDVNVPPSSAGRQRSNPFLECGDVSPKVSTRRAVSGNGGGGGAQWHRAVPAGTVGGAGSTESLVCEGPLMHVATGKKPRWVVLTRKKLMFYLQNASELMATVRREHVTTVRAVGDKRIHIAVAEPASNGITELVLECSKTPVRTKWMHALETPLHGQGSRSSNEELIVEGPLLKLQPFGSMNRTRWVRVTTKRFAYYVAEAGEMLGSVEYDNITNVFLEGKRKFTLRASVPFTRTGLYEVNAQCPNEKVRQKWITGLARVLPVSLFKGGDYTK